MLLDSIWHPCIKLLSFEFPTSFHFQFGAKRYITGLNRTSENKVIVVRNCSELVFSILSVSIYDDTQSDIRVKIIVIWICYKLPFSIWSILIYYGTQSDIRVKSYCCLNMVRASVFNLERLDILWDSSGHPCIKLLLFEFATIFHFQFRASWYITGLNRTSEYKVIAVCICYERSFSISSVSIYYRTKSDIWAKTYCRLNYLRGYVLMQSSLGRDQSLEPWARGSKKIGLELLKKALGFSWTLG